MNSVEEKQKILDIEYFYGKILMSPVYRRKIIVDKEYRWGFSLDAFYLENRKSFCIYDYRINSENYKNPTDVFIPGGEYMFEIYTTLDKIEGHIVLEFMDFIQSLKVGPRGLPILWQFDKKAFPSGGKIFSFDKEEKMNFWRGSRMIPFMHYEEMYKIFDFTTSPFEDKLGKGDMFLIVQKIK